MNVEEKLVLANKLKSDIESIESFVNLAKRAQEIDEKNAKQNEFKGVNRFISCHISAYISTGSQSPMYKRELSDNDVIVALMHGGLPAVENMLKQKKVEIESLFT